jgi:gluconate kinase
MGIRGELAIVRTAIARGYPIEDEDRRKLIESVSEIMSDKTAKPRERLAASRVFIAADLANQKITESEQQIKLLWELAEQNGITEDVKKLVE